MITDVAVFLFVAVLVLGGIFVPRVGDAIGRRLRRDAGPGGRPPREPGA
jgi:hypothetical protein